MHYPSFILEFLWDKFLHKYYWSLILNLYRVSSLTQNHVIYVYSLIYDLYTVPQIGRWSCENACTTLGLFQVSHLYWTTDIDIPQMELLMGSISNFDQFASTTSKRQHYYTYINDPKLFIFKLNYYVHPPLLIHISPSTLKTSY